MALNCSQQTKSAGVAEDDDPSYLTERRYAVARASAYSL